MTRSFVIFVFSNLHLSQAIFAMTAPKRIIVWYRKDLRLHDNEALTRALENSDEVIPVYVFNEDEWMGETLYGFKKTGVHRAQFLLDSVAALKAQLQAKGIDLVVRVGKPEEEVFELAKATGAVAVHANMERLPDEVGVQNALERNLWTEGMELFFFRGKMLYYTQDLPFPIAHAPDSFGVFRKEVERFIPVREPLVIPEQLAPWTCTIDTGELPTLELLGHQEPIIDQRAEYLFDGGECAGLERLHTYFGAERHLDTYANTRYDLTGPNKTAKISPWLASGCLSPKYVYAELKAYESRYKANKSTQTFFQELLWRDYYRLMGKKYRSQIFERGGILGRETKDLEEDETAFELWKNGETDVPLINALMIQLRQTGYIPQKGRQLVASYLVNDLGVHWRMGAAYFQHILVDYDICSNWVNWNMVGGVGPDPKDDRFLNIESQAKRYDSKGDYTDQWLGSVLS